MCASTCMCVCVCVLQRVSMWLICSAVWLMTAGVSEHQPILVILSWPQCERAKVDAEPRAIAKILGHSLTCTSASAPQEYFPLLREGSVRLLHKDRHSISGKGRPLFAHILSQSPSERHKCLCKWPKPQWRSDMYKNIDVISARFDFFIFKANYIHNKRIITMCIIGGWSAFIH